MKYLLLQLLCLLLCFTATIQAQEEKQKRTPDSTPSSSANAQFKQKLQQQLSSRFKTYFFGKKSHTFIVSKKQGIMITQECGDKIEKSKCLAALKLQQVNINDIKTADLQGNKNPGAILCQTLEAEIISGKDKNGNVGTFCSFRDGTMVSSDSLVVWGKKNAQANKD